MLRNPARAAFSDCVYSMQDACRDDADTKFNSKLKWSTYYSCIVVN